MIGKKILFSLFAVLFLAGGLIASGVSAVPPANAGATEILIGFEGAPNPATHALIRAQGWEITGELPRINVLVVTVPDLPELPGLPGAAPEDPLARARKALEDAPGIPEISFVEENGMMYAHGQIIPWGIERIGAVEAHNISTGSGVAIAILDTGIDVRHEDLTVAGGYAVVNCHPAPQCAAAWDDDHGHGTHVAGTAAALKNEVGVLGAAPDVNLYAVKVLDRRGGGTFAGVAEGIIWAADQGIEVLNMSLGGGHSDTVQSAVVYAYDKGSLLVASAGNDYGGSVNYPAAYTEVIAVSATDKDDKIAGFSSQGDEVEFAAPGVDIYSTLPGNSYGTYSGTSMSAPHVAGTAALVWATNLNLTNVEVRGILQNSAEDIGLTPTQQGFGLVNAAAAVGVEPPATGSIEGTVTDGENGAAIDGATVAVEGTNLSVTTNPEGYYLLENVPTGDRKVIASADGYYSQTAAVTVVEDATITQDFVLQAIPTYTVSGTVKDTGGNALGEAAVVIEGTGLSAVTGNDGTYSISDVEEGIYDITASKSGYVSQTKNITVESDATVDFTLTEITEELQKMYVNSIEMWYKAAGPNRFVYTKIEIVSFDGASVSGATVYLKMTLPDGSTASGSGNTANDGTITFELRSRQTGTYTSTVTDVVKDGWEYDSSENVESSKTLAVN